MHSGAIHVVRIRGDGREADAAPPSGVESRSEWWEMLGPVILLLSVFVFSFYHGHFPLLQAKVESRLHCNSCKDGMDGMALCLSLSRVRVSESE